MKREEVEKRIRRVLHEVDFNEFGIARVFMALYDCIPHEPSRDIGLTCERCKVDRAFETIESAYDCGWIRVPHPDRDTTFRCPSCAGAKPAETSSAEEKLVVAVKALKKMRDGVEHKSAAWRISIEALKRIEGAGERVGEPETEPGVASAPTRPSSPALDSSIVKAREETDLALKEDCFPGISLPAERAISDAMLTHYQHLHNDRVAQCAALIHERDAARREVEVLAARIVALTVERNKAEKERDAAIESNASNARKVLAYAEEKRKRRGNEAR